MPNGDNLWLLKIHSPDAFSINLIYNRFNLGKGSKFFIYNENREMTLGAFTPEVSNNPYNEFVTTLVRGNTIVLEYYEPVSSDDGVIHISKVIHGYVNTFVSDRNGTSADCIDDIMCALGKNWQSEAQAVVMLLVNWNTALCSGCLVNNTNNDFKPYVLTARHCFYDQNGGVQTTNPATTIYRFFYWNSNCGSGSPTTIREITGATLRAHYASTDMALVELNTQPPNTWPLYFAGWDRTIAPVQNATGIHHPKGDVMKINYEQHQITNHDYVSSSGQFFQLWRVPDFEYGTIQLGSSGSPLFNQNHRIVGQLSGLHPNNPCSYLTGNNENICNCNNPWADYGRFNISWTGGNTSGTRLSDYLSPGSGSQPPYLDGIPYSSISGPSVTVVGNSPQYSVNFPPSSYTWDCSSHFQNLLNGNFKALNAGNAWVRILVNGVERARQDVSIILPALVINGPDNVCSTSSATYTISSGTVSSWQVLPTSPAVFTIVSSNSTSITLQTSYNNGWVGTILAYVNGMAPPVKPSMLHVARVPKIPAMFWFIQILLTTSLR